MLDCAGRARLQRRGADSVSRKHLEDAALPQRRAIVAAVRGRS